MTATLQQRPDATSTREKDGSRDFLKRCAGRAVRQDIAGGRLTRPDRCQRCGRGGPVDAHHFLGYLPENWTDVEWLCKRCHARADRQFEPHAEDRKTVTASALRVLKSCWGTHCGRCGTAERLQWDHIKPLSIGGVHCLGNLQRLCADCNRTKGRRFCDYRTAEQKAWVFSRVLGSAWRHIARGPYYLPDVVLAESTNERGE